MIKRAQLIYIRARDFGTNLLVELDSEDGTIDYSLNLQDGSYAQANLNSDGDLIGWIYNLSLSPEPLERFERSRVSSTMLSLIHISEPTRPY